MMLKIYAFPRTFAVHRCLNLSDTSTGSRLRFRMRQRFPLHSERGGNGNLYEHAQAMGCGGLVRDLELDRCSDFIRSNKADREKEIHSFAESQGWTAVILTVDSGIRVIFRKLKQGIAKDGPKSVVPG